MKTKNLLFIIVLIVALAESSTTPYCPAQSNLNVLLHGHFTISTAGTVNLIPNQDTLCYNYSLPAPFQNQPGVALALPEMAASPSNQLFFSIQPIKSDSLSLITFMIRTQWKYTTWNIFKVSFIAEDHPHFSANSYAVDTAALAGCSSQQ